MSHRLRFLRTFAVIACLLAAPACALRGRTASPASLHQADCGSMGIAWGSDGTITNTDTITHNFVVSVAYTNDQGLVNQTSHETFPDLAPGQSANWSIGGLAGDLPADHCVVSYTMTPGPGPAAIHITPAMLLVIDLVVLAVTVPFVIGLVFIFGKAGRPRWAAILPIYNSTCSARW